LSTPTDQALERALAAPTATAQLAELVDAWRSYESPVLADLVAAASKRAVAEQPVPDDGGSFVDKQARWLEVAARASPVELPWLLARAVTARRQETLIRLRVIAKLPRDPRIAATILECCANPELRSHPPVWTLIFSILRNARDPRLATRVAELTVQLRPVTDFDRMLHSHLERLALVTASREPLAPPHPSSELIAQLTARLLKDETAVAEIHRVKTAEDFMAEIWADPNDDGPREVFADWLIERGDPRGELITLQLARARGTVSEAGARRERVLLVANIRTWLGPLDPVISKSRCYFERGFVARCEVVWRRLGAQRELWKHPAWATVREYKLASEGERECDAWLDHMISLGAKRV
jgi:uncharacterized protein (TIGR02996 family)